MTHPQREPIRGLEQVIAANTAISFVDGQNGKLYYRGYDIDELAGRASFEEIVHLLWFGELPTAAQLQALRGDLVADMRLPTQVYDLLRLSPPSANPMVVLRTAVSALSLYDPDGGTNDWDANIRKGKRILAQVATIVAAHHRLRTNQSPLSPDPKRSFAWNFLYMLRGTVPGPLEEQVFDALLGLHADHGLAASTFAARVTVSTLAGMHSAMAAALACLKGPLHGGANTRVSEMLDAIGSADAVEDYINGMLQSGQRIMGFGHRVYKTEDPRSRHLKELSEPLCVASGTSERLATSRAIEKIVLERKGIRPNVDFYSATVQNALGIPASYFTCIFAVARTTGWVAHVMEQFDDNRLIRPTSNYIGGFHRKFSPIAER